MLRHLTGSVIFLLPYVLAAQERVQPPEIIDSVLKNAGQPIHVPYKCAEDELQFVGLLCSEDEPCPIFLELSSVATAGKKLFLGGDLHATAGTLSSILLMSDDAGATWKEPARRIRGAALDQMEFYDLEHGWAAGEIQYPLPADPFFLVTSDGGQTWRNRPVTEEGGPGSVYRFWFDSAQHGELIIDAGKSSPSGRYIDYESETGGESWMVRSATGALPKIRRAPPAFENPDYRLRATPGGKAYQLEKRLDEKWEPVASFLIEVAACKLKGPELKEPPPETNAAGVEAAPEKDYVEELNLGGNAKTPPRKPAPKKKGPNN